MPLLPTTKDWTIVVTSHLKPLLLPPPAISKSLTTATPNAPSWNTPSGPICFATAGAVPGVCGIPVPSTLHTQVKRQAHSFDEKNIAWDKSRTVTVLFSPHGHAGGNPSNLHCHWLRLLVHKQEPAGAVAVAGTRHRVG